MKTVTAFTEGRKRTWEYKPLITESLRDGKIRKILSINPPIEYELTEDFISKLEQHRTITIDMGGLHHGVRESVYINCEDLLEIIYARFGEFGSFWK